MGVAFAVELSRLCASLKRVKHKGFRGHTPKKAIKSGVLEGVSLGERRKWAIEGHTPKKAIKSRGLLHSQKVRHMHAPFAAGRYILQKRSGSVNDG